MSDYTAQHVPGAFERAIQEGPEALARYRQAVWGPECYQYIYGGNQKPAAKPKKKQLFGVDII